VGFQVRNGGKQSSLTANKEFRAGFHSVFLEFYESTGRFVLHMQYFFTKADRQIKTKVSHKYGFIN